jgi:hypothetical protein
MHFDRVEETMVRDAARWRGCCLAALNASAAAEVVQRVGMPDSCHKLRNVGRALATTRETKMLLREIGLKQGWGRC